MTTIDVTCNGKRVSIEICEVWDFVRDIHLYQANVVYKVAMQRHIIGRYKTKGVAEQKAREWIDSQ